MAAQDGPMVRIRGDRGDGRDEEQGGAEAGDALIVWHRGKAPSDVCLYHFLAISAVDGIPLYEKGSRGNGKGGDGFQLGLLAGEANGSDARRASKGEMAPSHRPRAGQVQEYIRLKGGCGSLYVERVSRADDPQSRGHNRLQQ